MTFTMNINHINPTTSSYGSPSLPVTPGIPGHVCYGQDEEDAENTDVPEERSGEVTLNAESEEDAEG